jgi:hypothetical protein
VISVDLNLEVLEQCTMVDNFVVATPIRSDSENQSLLWRQELFHELS